MTDCSGRYFFSVGTHRDCGDEAVCDALLAAANKGVVEDKTMIEAQQQIIDSNPERHVMPTTADRGIALFHQIVKNLVHEESTPSRSPWRTPG